MEDIYVAIGQAIRMLRMSFQGRGLSQAELGRAIKISPNTISRWETGIYKPSIADLAVLARFFGISISQMFPQSELSAQLTKLVNAADGLEASDLQEVITFVLFKRAMAESRMHGENNTDNSSRIVQSKILNLGQ